MKKATFLIAMMSITLISCGPSAKDHYEKGNIASFSEDYKTAIAEYDKAIEMEPTNAEYFHSRGLAKYANGKFNEAIEDFNKTLELNYFDETAVLIERGKAKAFLDNHKEAIADFNKVIEIDPENSSAYLNRAISKSYLSDDYTDQINDYNKAIEIDPDYGRAYYNRGLLKIDTADYKGALEDFDTAVKKDFKLAYFGRGKVKYELKQYQEALLDFNHILFLSLSVEESKTKGEIYLYRGMTNIHLNKLDEACTDFKMAKKFGDEEADEYLNEYCK